MKVLCSHQRGRSADFKELVPLRVRTIGICKLTFLHRPHLIHTSLPHLLAVNKIMNCKLRYWVGQKVCSGFSIRWHAIIQLYNYSIIIGQLFKLEKQSSDLISQHSICPLFSYSNLFACSSPSIADFFQLRSSFCLECPFSYYFSSPKTTDSLKFCSRG